MAKKRKIYTVYQGDKYPKDYPRRLAQNLDRFRVELHCLVTARSHPERGKNLVLFEHVNDIEQAGFTGWWTKLVFFSKAYYSHSPIWVVDIDTVFLRDPEPLFSWEKENQSRLIGGFITDPLKRREAGTSLFWLNNYREETATIFDKYVAEKQKPPRGGDQFWITPKLPENKWEFLPSYFQCQYKSFYFPGGENALWESTKNFYNPYDIKDMISVHFSGHPWPHEVIEKNMSGKQLILNSGWAD